MNSEVRLIVEKLRTQIERQDARTEQECGECLGHIAEVLLLPLASVGYKDEHPLKNEHGARSDLSLTRKRDGGLLPADQIGMMRLKKGLELLEILAWLAPGGEVRSRLRFRYVLQLEDGVLVLVQKSKGIINQNVVNGLDWLCVRCGDSSKKLKLVVFPQGL